MRWAGHVDRMEEGRTAFKILTGKPAGKSPFGKPKRRFEDNIRMYLKEIGISTRNSVDSVQDRDYWKSIVKMGIEPSCYISHRGNIENP